MVSAFMVRQGRVISALSSSRMSMSPGAATRYVNDAIVIARLVYLEFQQSRIRVEYGQLFLNLCKGRFADDTSGILSVISEKPVSG